MRVGEKGERLCSAPLELADLAIEQETGKERRHQVGDGHGEPHAQFGVVKEVGQDQQAGDEENHLPCERKEDALAGLTYALEKGGGNNLHPDEGEHNHRDAQTRGRALHELRSVLGKGRNAGCGKELAHDKSQCGDAGGGDDGVLHHACHAVHLLCTEVVAGNGLHALIQSNHNEDNEREQTGDDAIGAHGCVAAIFGHGTGDDDAHQGCAGIDQKLWQSDEDGLAHDAPVRAEDVEREMNGVFLVGKKIDLPAEHRHLRQHRGEGSARNAPAEAEDEEGTESGIDEDTAEGGVHGQSGAVGGAQLGVQSIEEMGEDVTQKDDVHELPRIGQGGIARTKGAQDGVEKEIDTHLKEESAEAVEQHHVAQDFARRLIVLLTEAHTHQRGAAHTHHRTKGSRDGHERIGERKAGDGVGTHTLPNEDAIDNVVERRGHHGDDGRQGILEQEGAHGLFAQNGVLFGRGHGSRKSAEFVFLHEAIDEFDAAQCGTTAQGDDDQAEKTVVEGLVGKTLVVEDIAHLGVHGFQYKAVVKHRQEQTLFHTAQQKFEVGFDGQCLFAIEAFDQARISVEVAEEAGRTVFDALHAIFDEAEEEFEHVLCLLRLRFHKLFKFGVVVFDGGNDERFLVAEELIECALRDFQSVGNVVHAHVSQPFFAKGLYGLQNDALPRFDSVWSELRHKIIIKIYLSENKEVTLFVQLNW